MAHRFSYTLLVVSGLGSCIPADDSANRTSGESSSAGEERPAHARVSPLVRPANPFDAPGDRGVGVGWAALRATQAGTLIHVEDGALVLEAPPDDKDAVVVACQEKAVPAGTRSWVQGEWRMEDVAAPKKWQGARLLIRYFDSAGQMLAGDTGRLVFQQAQGTRSWARVDGAFLVPEQAVNAKLCVEMHKATTGKVWVRDYAFVETPKGAGATQPNVLFIVIDALRARSLGVYGESAPVSPNIDAFSENALVFDHAWTQYTWTVPSYVSYMGSQYPRTHGWTYGMEEAIEKGTVLDERVSTLASVLQGAGYATIAYYANSYLKAAAGMGRGFYGWEFGIDDITTERALADLGEWSRDGMSNFLYVHLMGTHMPLCPSEQAQQALGFSIPPRLTSTPPAAKCPRGGVRHYADYNNLTMPESEQVAWYQKAYLGEVWDADRRVGRILDALRETGEWENTIVVIASDHGELLGEHEAMGHGSYIWEEVSAVPLLLAGEGVKPGRETDRVAEMIDVAPTILELAGLQDMQPASWQGQSLLSLPLSGLAVVQRDDKIAFTADGRWKVVGVRWAEGIHQAYDLQVDPGEANTLHDDPPPEVAALFTAAQEWEKLHPEQIATGDRIAMSEDEMRETMDKLKVLGYVEP